MPSFFPPINADPSSSAARVNLFLDKVSPAGVKLVKILLSLDEKITLCITHMLVAALKEMAAVAKREASRARAARDLYEQIREKLDQARVMHNEEVIRLRTVADGAYQQLEEVRPELERSRVEAKVFHTPCRDLGR